MCEFCHECGQELPEPDPSLRPMDGPSEPSLLDAELEFLGSLAIEDRLSELANTVPLLDLIGDLDA